MINSAPILAEASAQQAQGGGMSMIWMIAIYAVIIGAIYFFLLRPNSKKKKEEAQMRNNLEIGDEITTIGGIMGRVVAIKDEEDALIIETGSDRVKMKFKKWAISSVDTVKENVEKPKSKLEQLQEAREAKRKAKEEKKAQKNNE